MFEQILIDNRSYLGVVLAALIGALTAIYVQRKNRFTVAADAFRKVILSEMQGIIPVNGFWPKEEYSRIKNSIPIIKRAALEFRPAIPFYRRRHFDEAVMKFCEKAGNANFDTAIADVFYSEEVIVTQKETIVKCVHCILSFTE